MKKGFSVGNLIVLIVIIILIKAVIIPKINATKDVFVGGAYVQELEIALKQIKEDLFAQGDFRTLRDMTTVRQFEDDVIDQKIEVDKPIKFGVGVKSKGNMKFCTEITIKEESNGKYVAELTEINTWENECKEFHSMAAYSKLKRFELN